MFAWDDDPPVTLPLCILLLLILITLAFLACFIITHICNNFAFAWYQQGGKMASPTGNCHTVTTPKVHENLFDIIIRSPQSVPPPRYDDLFPGITFVQPKNPDSG